MEALDQHGNTELHRIIQDNSLSQKEIVERLKILLNKGIDINLQNEQKQTIFHWAVKNRMRVVIDFLINHEVKLDNITHFFIEDEYNKFRQKILKFDVSNWLEMETESANFVKWLVSKGFDFDIRNEKNESALQMAIRYNLQHILLVLLKSTKDINFIDEKNKTLLHLILEKCASCGFSSINTERYSNRYIFDIFKILLDRGVSADALDDHNITPLQMAIYQQEESSIIEILVQRCTKIHMKWCNSDTLLHGVIRKFLSSDWKTKNFLITLQSIIAKIVNANDSNNGFIPSNHAVESLTNKSIGRKDKKFSVLMKDGKTLLHCFLACIYFRKPVRNIYCNEAGFMEIFHSFVNGGVDINAKDKTGTTLMHLAVMNTNSTIVEMLIKLGADVNCRNNNMETPFHLAIRNSEAIEICEILLRKGANVNARDSKGQTVLHMAYTYLALQSTACLDDRLSLIKKLLSFGVDVNTKDLQEHSVLYCAWNLIVSKRRISKTDRLEAIAIMVTLIKHSIKLNVAGFPWDRTINDGGFLDFVKSSFSDKKYYMECLKEIEKLKKTLIDKKVTLYTFLHMDPIRRCRYYREQLEQFVHSSKLVENFPEYSILILSTYNEAVVRRFWLLNQAKEAFIKFADTDLPDLCIECIFAYLSNSDLFNLIEKH